jgi:hypothetical protein
MFRCWDSMWLLLSQSSAAHNTAAIALGYKQAKEPHGFGRNQTSGGTASGTAATNREKICAVLQESLPLIALPR